MWALFVASCTSLTAAQTTGQPDGQQVFTSHCATCHGLDGRGGEHAPDIATNSAVQQKSDRELTNIVSKGISAAGMPAFESLLGKAQVNAVVGYLRTLQKGEGEQSVTGDAIRGSAVFFGAGRCAACHMINGRGGFLAADLSGYGKTHSPAGIREWILDPDKNNRDLQRGAVSVVTRHGERYRGVIRNEDNFSLQMQTLDGEFRLLDKSDLQTVEREPRSLMPNDYRAKLTTAQLDDLVAFLLKAPGGTPGSGTHNDDDQ